MSGLKEVRSRISSTISTQQITSAMKMVSAAKLRRAQDAILQMRPYAEKLQEILGNLTATLDSSSGGDFSKERPVKNVLLVVITSNRGLCGAFNANAIKKALRAVNEKYAAQKANGGLQIMSIGKKANDYFRKTGYALHSNHSEVFDNLNFEKVSAIADTLMMEFASGKFDAIELFYNQFKNAASQVVNAEAYLPVPKSEKPTESKQSSADYIFEPEKEEIVKDLIPRALRTQLYKAVLDSHAAEHGARMTSMHKATDNANEILRELRLTYNKARQASITKEILEIVGGAEALKN